MDHYANTAAAQRQQVIDHSWQTTRAREKEHYAAQRARAKAFCEASLLERLAASPVSAEQAAAARRKWGISE